MDVSTAEVAAVTPVAAGVTPVAVGAAPRPSPATDKLVLADGDLQRLEVWQVKIIHVRIKMRLCPAGELGK